ncbi:MAG TPA: tetratricopeptide repeat protein [Vicinamibacteria bacterium]|nr:tetratricopeptide repeat protein [Vicinamibacteria bacterium]
MGRRLSLFLLVAGGLALKATVLIELGDHPLLQPTGVLDSAAYVRLAGQVVGGDYGLGSDVYYLSPFYVYFLASIFALSAGSLLVVKAVQVVLGALAVGLVFATSRRWQGERAAWIAGVLAAGTGVFTFNEVLILQSALDPLLTALALFLLSRALSTGAGRDFAATGAALGALALNRPNALAYAGVLVVLLGVRNRGRDWRRALALACGLAVPIAPVAVRNAVVAGDFVLISSHGGLNFYIGNNPDADGTYHRVPGITPSIEGQERDARLLAEKAVGRRLRASEVSAYFYARAWDWIREHPGTALLQLCRKIAYVFNATDLSLNYSYAYYSRDEPTLLRFLVVGPWLLAPLGLWGLAVVWRRTPDFPLWGSFVPVYALSVAAFFVSSRYRLPLLIPLCVGAGAAVDRLLALVRERKPRALLGHLAVLTGLTLFANWDFGLDDGRSQERTEMILFLVDHGRTEEAKALLAKTERAHPERGALYYRTASALRERGETAAARDVLGKASPADAGASALALGGLALDLEDAPLAQRFLREAVARAPSSAEARERLGLALALQGDGGAALLELGEACRLDPERASAHLNLAVVLAQAGRLADARAQAREALRLQPDYPQARGLLAELDHTPR